MRQYYAELNGTVYAFDRRQIRNDFVEMNGGSCRIYAYQRARYREQKYMSHAVRIASKSNETVKNDTQVMKTQNMSNRAISDRLRMFKGQR